MDDGFRRGPDPLGPLPSVAPHARGDNRPQRHLELVDSLSTLLRANGSAGAVTGVVPDHARRWALTALHACLTHLLTSGVTEASRVSIVDAWVDGENALCIVYVPPFDEGRLVGVRRTRFDASFPDYWRLGDRTGWGYELRPADAPVAADGSADGPDESSDDPVAFGWNVADFDVGEPLGYVTTILRHDRADVGWWGDLGAVLPTPPADD